jgi:glycosyltransferase involved in cell wall biosynthesis
MSDPYLSIVVPAYNEALRIGISLEKIREYVRTRNYPVELIIIDDGSKDETPDILEEVREHFPPLKVLRNEPNRGKGYSVRRGVLEARGELVLFTDSDLSAPIEEANKLIAALESERADAAVGSRALERRLIGVRQPAHREFAGRIFNLLVRLFTGLKIRDTQCGMKLFRSATTRRAFELQRVDGFGFDPELLFIIQRLGRKIVEVPMRWNDNPATKVNFLRDSSRMFWDLAALRWRALRGVYNR